MRHYYRCPFQVLNSCQAALNAAKLSEEKTTSVMRDVNAMVLELEGLLHRTNSIERLGLFTAVQMYTVQCNCTG